MVVSVPLWNDGRLFVALNRGVGLTVVRWRKRCGDWIHDDPPPDGGVREPRRPLPGPLAGGIELPVDPPVS